jgi:hypothetical protein
MTLFRLGVTVFDFRVTLYVTVENYAEPKKESARAAAQAIRQKADG